MYARYQKGKQIVLIFDLEHGKEIGCAFTFFYGGNHATPFTEPIKSQMNDIEEALKNDILAKVAFDEECKHFQLCIRCTTEIDLSKSGWSQGQDGAYFHNTCPKLKSPQKRDV